MDSKISLNEKEILGQKIHFLGSQVFRGSYEKKEVAVKQVSLETIELSRSQVREALLLLSDPGHENVIKLLAVQDTLEYRLVTTYYIVHCVANNCIYCYSIRLFALELAAYSLYDCFQGTRHSNGEISKLPPVRKGLLDMANGLKYIRR